MTDAKRVFIDTNALIRATVATAPDHEKVKNLVQTLGRSGTDLWISRQILREYAAVLTRPQTYITPAEPSVIAEQLQSLMQRFYIADENASVTARLIRLMQTVSVSGKQIHDANIVATMQAYEINYLLTFNHSDFVRYTGLITLVSTE